MLPERVCLRSGRGRNATCRPVTRVAVAKIIRPEQDSPASPRLRRRLFPTAFPSRSKIPSRRKMAALCCRFVATASKRAVRGGGRSPRDTSAYSRRQWHFAGGHASIRGESLSPLDDESGGRPRSFEGECRGNPRRRIGRPTDSHRRLRNWGASLRYCAKIAGCAHSRRRPEPG